MPMIEDDLIELDDMRNRISELEIERDALLAATALSVALIKPVWLRRMNGTALTRRILSVDVQLTEEAIWSVAIGKEQLLRALARAIACNVEQAILKIGFDKN